MDLVIFSAIVFTIIIVWQLMRPKKLGGVPGEFPDEWRALLRSDVAYYLALDEAEQERFETLILRFLEHVRITGVGTDVEDIDRLLTAAGAIIPIFGLDDAWLYPGLHEVLLYPAHFDESFDFHSGGDEEERTILGMVGDGQMSRVMILSQPALRNGFKNSRDRRNVAIHEFAHLIDKADGVIDGVPDILLEHRFTAPWLKRIHSEVQKITQGSSDINPYGASRREEFFPVVAEYFFERPKQMRRNHPELYELLQVAFQQSMADRVLRRVKVGSVGRNAPCPCGSGRKYKRCCGKRGGRGLKSRINRERAA